VDGWTMGVEGWLLVGAWIVALLFIVWLLVREPNQPPHDPPLETLRSRLARGEISEAEYLQARRLLEMRRGETR